MRSINSIAVRRLRPRHRPQPLGLKPRRQSLKSLLLRGSQLMGRLMQDDPEIAQDARSTWETLGIAYSSSSEADARTALTQLQTKLHQWTGEDANVAADEILQRYRHLLHLALDHGESP